VIVNNKQYQQLLQELLISTAPALWRLLNTPHGMLREKEAWFTRTQTKARRELHRVAAFPVPERGFLDFDDEENQ
jgi:hypothetical protein